MANFEFELDDTIGTANNAIFGIVTGGQLNTIGDVDTFKFVLTESAALGIKFTLPAGATNESFSIRFLDSAGDLIFSNAGGVDFSNFEQSLYAGTYYFQISAANLDEFSSEDYGLTVSTLPPIPAQGEPPFFSNNAAVDATEIVIGTGASLVDAVNSSVVLGNLNNVADVDYYKFNSLETGVYSFSFDAPTNLTPDEVVSPLPDAPGTIKEFFKISILDENEVVLVSHYVSGTPEDGYSFSFGLDASLNPTGDYYVKIENGGSIAKISTLQYSFDINPVEANENNANQVFGSSGADYLLGTSTSDVIKGNAGNDVITGKAGSDSLDGGSGVDTLKGGLGNDTYIVDVTTDKIIELVEQGVDKVITTVSYTLASNVENLIFAEATVSSSGKTIAAISGKGNVLDNVIVGNELANTLSGLAGDDTIDGGFGFKGDVLIGGAGNDTYYINNRLDKITEIAGPTNGIDLVLAKVDVMALSNNVENLQLLEVPRSSEDGSSLATYGIGNAIANIILGNSADNQISGLGGNDSLKGGAGNDALIGGLGNDTLVGGSGSDYFIFEKALSATTNVDTIKDFVSGEDAIQLSRLIFTKLVGSAGNLYEGEVSAANFVTGLNALDANDYLIYDSVGKDLYYDVDGSGAAGKVHFAHLDSGTVAITDFTVL